MTNKKLTYIFIMASLLVMPALQSCDDDDDDATPVVRYVRPVPAASADSLMEGQYLGEVIAIIGEHLDNVRELKFNEVPALLNTCYMTDNAIIVTIPKTVPHEITDKMYITARNGDKVEFPFVTKIPSPVISSMDCEYVKVGDMAYINGNYFVGSDEQPVTVTFSGNVKGEIDWEKSDLDNFERLAVKVPDGAQDGPITITSAYGTTVSKLELNDKRGMLFDFDGLTGLTEQGWHPRDKYIMEDETSITGKFVQLGTGTAKMSESGGWDDGNFSFEYWCGSWTDPQNFTDGQGMALNNLVDFTNWEKMGIKFEMYVPDDNPWSAGAMQVIFAGTDLVTLSGYPKGGPYPEANNLFFQLESKGGKSMAHGIYRPWEGLDNGFSTGGKWITVTMPFSQFIYATDGSTNVGQKLKQPDDFASLTIFVFEGGTNGTECYPIIKIDNIRAVEL